MNQTLDVLADELDNPLDDVEAVLVGEPTVRELLREILRELRNLNGNRYTTVAYPYTSTTGTATAPSSKHWWNFTASNTSSTK